jgi:hypothetical protein
VTVFYLTTRPSPDWSYTIAVDAAPPVVAIAERSDVLPEQRGQFRRTRDGANLAPLSLL